MIIINSEKIAKDLLDRETSNSSDRPSIFFNELWVLPHAKQSNQTCFLRSGSDYATGLLPYGDCWWLHRWFFHQMFRIDAAQRFLPYQHQKACQLLRQLFSTPKQFDEHVVEYVFYLECSDGQDLTLCWDTILLSFLTVHMIMISHLILMMNSSSLWWRWRQPVYLFCVPTSQSLFPPFWYVSNLQVSDFFGISLVFSVLKLLAWFPSMSFKNDMEIVKKLTKQFVEMAFEYTLQRVVKFNMLHPIHSLSHI